jgi:hypothetical protein
MSVLPHLLVQMRNGVPRSPDYSVLVPPVCAQCVWWRVRATLRACSSLAVAGAGAGRSLPLVSRDSLHPLLTLASGPCLSPQSASICYG